MNFKALSSLPCLCTITGEAQTKTLRIMKLTAVILLLGFLQVSARGYSQRITLSETNAPVQKIFREIWKQSGFQFVYTDKTLEGAKTVTIRVKGASLDEVLKACSQDQPFSFAISENAIIVTQRQTVLPAASEPPPPVDFTGIIREEHNRPLEGVSVEIKALKKGTQTNSKGEFGFTKIPPGSYTLIVSSIGYQSQKIVVKVESGMSPLSISLVAATDPLDQNVVIGYGMTSKRYNTGSVSTVKSETIEKQAVADPLVAIQGRAPGLLITNNSGLPGTSPTIQIRGINSLSGSQPLYIVDGVPFVGNSINTTSAYGATLTIGFSSNYAGESPFKSIDPASIESIEILKDADATAIYGARGANGVILITTKKGKTGRTNFDVDVYHSIAKVPHFIDMLNTDQYLAMRREAFKNDGETPDSSTAPDLLVWDQKANTDWQRKFLGTTAHTDNAEATLSGGDARTRFLIGAGFRNETTIYPGDYGLKRGTVRFNIDHNSLDNKFNVLFSASYATDKNKAVPGDLLSYYALPPNFPLYNTDGSVNWTGLPYGLNNPLAALLISLENKTTNLSSNLQLKYKLLPGLQLKVSLGYNNMAMNQMELIPSVSQNPLIFGVVGGSSIFGTSGNSSYVIEPQADYSLKRGNSRFHVLLGSTYLGNNSKSTWLNGKNYTNDAQLNNIMAAGTITSSGNSQAGYKFLSGFSRLSYDWKNKYLLNITVRRDGSSRFGPNKQYGNFGAVGAGWIFSEEPGIKNNFSFLSYGKLRGSYGITGNDQISDYQYSVNWAASTQTYQTSGQYPTNLYNPNYRWETNKKLEGAVELGFWQDRILLTVDYYRNRSGNQLVSYPLASQAGYTLVTANLPALIQNSGFEFELNTVQIRRSGLSWTTSLNLTIARNKLIAFPGLASSSYNYTYAIGQPLSLFWGYSFDKIDAATGTAVFKNLDANGNPVSVPTSNLPTFYGGINNSVMYKGWQLDVFLQFRKLNKAFFRSYGEPGTLENEDKSVLGRWQNPGDDAKLPPFSQAFGTAYSDWFNVSYSTANLYNASYIRLGSLSLGYNFPVKWINKIGMQQCRLYAMGNNLFTITKFPGYDPETGMAVPTLRAITFGIKSTF